MFLGEVLKLRRVGDVGERNRAIKVVEMNKVRINLNILSSFKRNLIVGNMQGIPFITIKWNMSRKVGAWIPKEMPKPYYLVRSRHYTILCLNAGTSNKILLLAISRKQ